MLCNYDNYQVQNKSITQNSSMKSGDSSPAGSFVRLVIIICNYLFSVIVIYN